MSTLVQRALARTPVPHWNERGDDGEAGTPGGYERLALFAFLREAAMFSRCTDDQLAAPVGQLVAIVAVGALAGVLAAIRPARRAARLDVLDAIAVA